MKLEQHVIVLLVTTEKPIDELATKIAHRVGTLEGKVADCVALLHQPLDAQPILKGCVEPVPTGELVVQLNWAPKLD